MEPLARFGFAARGFVYLLVGGFALKAAFYGGRPSDNQDALSRVNGDGAGQILLIAVAVGLLGYGAWRLLDALFQRDSGDAKKRAARLGRLVSGVTHLLLAFAAATMALAGRSPGSNPQDGSARGWTAWLLSQPFGEAAVVLGGLVLLGVAFWQFKRAWDCGFMDNLGARPASGGWLLTLGRIGYAARGAVFALIAVLVVTAGLRHDPSEAGGMGKALSDLQAQPYGWLLLALIAAGLLAFGLFSMVEAKCRRIADPTARIGA